MVLGAMQVLENVFKASTGPELSRILEIGPVPVAPLALYRIAAPFLRRIAVLFLRIVARFHLISAPFLRQMSGLFRLRP